MPDKTHRGTKGSKVGNNKTTIEFNGRKYNALTGEMLSQKDNTPSMIHPTVRSHAPSSNPAHQQGRVLDGIGRAPSTPRPHLPQAAHSQPQPKKTHQRTAAAHARHRTPERSKTLMRTAVSKPQLSSAKATHRPAGVSAAHQAASPLKSQHPVHHPVSPSRIERAKSISKSSHISRFGSPAPAVAKKTAPLAVRPAPAHNAASAVRTSPSRPVANHHRSDRADFSQALQQATAHRQPSPKRPKQQSRTARRLGVSNRIVTTFSTALAVLLLVGFIGYQNMPNVSLRMAGAKAGFSASMPGYRPSGFALQGPIKYGPGEIVINFKSNSDDRAYRVTQRPSSWNSETLLENFVATDKKPYQTYQKQGKTIYIYNDSDATWVNGGVWYQVAGSSSLSSDQLLNIAASL
jgi:hypothetical protein